ncbi:MAG: bifunctional [glutamine synthetase] adenylyltransferase/[glutamine synthetase]-adenylyl-L-tyrosine phosphorylase [Pseudomonadota bacterium]
MTGTESAIGLDQVPWPEPADSRLLEIGWERWREQNGREGELPEGLLASLFGNSPFLTECAVREAETLVALQANGPDRTFKEIIDTLRRAQADGTDEAGLMRDLRIAKRQVALLVAVADIGALWTLDQVTGALSKFADTSLQLACRHCLRVAAASGAIELDGPADPESGSGLIVLGMGKLGAAELNYSSDVDLIVFYDPERIRTDDFDHLPRTMIRLVRNMVRIMEDHTPDGYVFRTDLRLRPDPGATPLAVNLAAAENYYESFAQNWERAAMIKARPVAGDIEAGEEFLTFLQPFVWRRNLDFAALQDIRNIKNLLDRKAQGAAMILEGHDLKIGHGGIREIEFFVQTQQLIFGGRDPRLRGRRTLENLQVLSEIGRIEPHVVHDLTNAYQRLRQIEHRVQMIQDHQTHRLPETADGIDRLACFLGARDTATFRAEMGDTLATVERHFHQLFDETSSEGSDLVFLGVEEMPGTELALQELGFEKPKQVVESVRGWLHGRYRACRSDRSRQLLTDMLPQLLSAIGRSPQPDSAFIRFDKFLAGLPAGVQLFSMFRAHPGLLDFVVELLGTSERTAEHLARNPAELDAVLTPGFFETLPDTAELAAEIDRLLAPQQYYEDELDTLRRWTRDHRFRASAHLMRGTTTGDRLGPYLADIAETGLAALQQRVEEEFARRHGRFSGPGLAIIALGKLGSRQMSIRSDLDLIMVFDAGDQTESDGDKPLGPTVYFTRLIQRLVSAITAQTAEGALYEVDMRLRPSGNAGPLATGLEAFVNYHRDQAWTWEQMALTRARCISGLPEMRERLGSVLSEILTRPRELDGLYRDVADMRMRIDKEHHHASPWVVKYARGGLIDIEFIAQCLQLRHAAERPEVLYTNTASALTHLGVAGLLPEATVDALVTTIRFCQRAQAFLRLVHREDLDVDTAPASILDGLARAVFPADTPATFVAADRRLRSHLQGAAAVYEELIEQPARQAGWDG